MDTCRVCGAAWYEGATFCARWHAPIKARAEEVDELLREVDAAAGRWQQPRTPSAPWRPDDRFVAPPPPLVESRTRASALTFGLGGRLAVTAAILIIVLGAFLYSPSPGSGLIFGVVSVWFLRDVWKKARIRIR